MFDNQVMYIFIENRPLDLLRSHRDKSVYRLLQFVTHHILQILVTGTERIMHQSRDQAGPVHY